MGAQAFPSDIVSISDGKLVLGNAIQRIITGHNFQINHAKLRLQARSQRQIVTGLKVNRFPNLSRRLLSQIRAMLHALKKFDKDLARTRIRPTLRPQKSSVISRASVIRCFMPCAGRSNSSGVFSRAQQSNIHSVRAQAARFGS